MALANVTAIDLDNPVLQSLKTITNLPMKLSNKVDCLLYKQHLFREQFNLLENINEVDREFNKAMSSIVHSDSLSLNNHSSVNGLISKFINLNIFETTGIDLFSFLDLSVESSNMLINSVTDINEKMAAFTADLNKGDTDG